MFAALLAACSSDDSATSGQDGSIEDDENVLVAELREALAAADVVALADAPAVSDELYLLGQALFFDPLLSGNQDISCSTCHLPSQATADGRSLPGGIGGFGTGPARSGGAVVPRHAPGIWNAHLSRSMFWDARVERLPGGGLRTPAGAALTPDMRAVFSPGLEVLAAQAMFPVTSRDEMRGVPGDNELADLSDDDLNAIWSGLMDRLLALPAYRQLFGAAYPNTTFAEWNFAHAANAIAGFETRAFSPVDSPLQRFLEGNDSVLSDEQLRRGSRVPGTGGLRSLPRRSGLQRSPTPQHRVGPIRARQGARSRGS